MPKILVIDPERLLGAALTCLLYQERNLVVLGFTPDTTSALVNQIHHIRPDVVLVDLASHFADALQRLPIYSYTGLHLISVSTEDNWVIIDDKQRVLITKRTDLAELVQNQPGQRWIEQAK